MSGPARGEQPQPEPRPAPQPAPHARCSGAPTTADAGAPSADATPASGADDPLAPTPLCGIRWVSVGPVLVLIRIYQLTLSPIVGRSCRFQPTCSRYMAEALRRFGLVRGGLLGLWRLLRCQPWGGHGFDPVPQRFPLGQRGAALAAAAASRERVDGGVRGDAG